jgi:hypothetical protein
MRHKALLLGAPVATMVLGGLFGFALGQHQGISWGNRLLIRELDYGLSIHTEVASLVRVGDTERAIVARCRRPNRRDPKSTRPLAVSQTSKGRTSVRCHQAERCGRLGLTGCWGRSLGREEPVSRIEVVRDLTPGVGRELKDARIRPFTCDCRAVRHAGQFSPGSAAPPGCRNVNHPVRPRLNAGVRRTVNVSADRAAGRPHPETPSAGLCRR